jgi:hypothetical protein
MYEARKLIDEFGYYAGVAVCKIELVVDSQDKTAKPSVSVDIYRKWLDYDEEYSFAMAEGFIEGIERRCPGEPKRETGVSSASYEPANVSSPPLDELIE